MGNRGRSIALVVILMLSALDASAAGEGRWASLGTRSWSEPEDRVVIPVTNWQAPIDGLRLQVGDGPVHVVSATVHFRNGETRTRGLSVTLTGGNSKELDGMESSDGITHVTLLVKPRSSPRDSIQVGLSGYLVREPDPASERWVLLHGGYLRDKEEMRAFRIERADGHLRKLQVEVREQGMEAVGLQVVYADEGGDRIVRLPLRGVLAPGASSRPFDLAGADRRVEEVRLSGCARAVEERGAVVQVWGLCVPAPGGSAPAASGWREVGSREVAGGARGDAIPITTTETPVRWIKLGVEGRGIRIAEIVLRFGDGTEHSVKLREEVRAGAETGEIELPGGPRILSEVHIYYRHLDRRGEIPVVRVLVRP